MRQRDHAAEVDVYLVQEGLQIYSLWLLPLVQAQNTRVEEDTVDVRELLEHVGGKGRRVSYFANIKLRHAGIGPMLFYKLFQSFCASANSRDLDPLFDEAGRHGKTDARGGADEEDMLVWKRHIDGSVCNKLTVRLKSVNSKKSGRENAEMMRPFYRISIALYTFAWTVPSTKKMQMVSSTLVYTEKHAQICSGLFQMQHYCSCVSVC